MRHRFSLMKADGKTPTINSPCDCHYKGTLIDGTEFDSSYKRGQPLSFAPNQVIRGWTEVCFLLYLNVYNLPTLYHFSNMSSILKQTKCNTQHTPYICRQCN